jgi:hypothetical protein
MKAKEYFERYVNDTSGKESVILVYEAIISIFLEHKELAKKRNAKSNEAFVAIFEELNKKANSFIKMVNEIEEIQRPKDILYIYIRHFYKDLYVLIKKHKNT